MSDANPTSESNIEEWEKAEDCTLYWTLSLYVDNDSFVNQPNFKKNLAFETQEKIQKKTWNSVGLRNAVEPLFNDIADRERIGRVEDYLLDVEDSRRSEDIQISMPDKIPWSTEGARFEVKFQSELSHALKVRRFWYVHRNGALSYHLSFTLKYQHLPEDLYFMSMLQKLVAPKEFEFSEEGKKAGLVGLFPLDEVRVKLEKDGKDRRFWRFVQERFDADAKGLLKLWGGKEPAVPKSVDDEIPLSPFADWVTKGKVIEVPGLDNHPTARALFVFHDKVFLDLLQKRDAKVKGNKNEEDFDAYPEAVEKWIQEAEKSEGLEPGNTGATPVCFAEDYWSWVKTGNRDSEAGFTPRRLERMCYLFLAGFNQNIIDFMNQDASEVLDSTDPIYPTNDVQKKEAFFYRFANPRAITSFVRKSRSLEVGNDWIGTCPYLFLIHVVALHNEFLAREYEEAASDLVHEAETATDGELAEKLAESFYDFNRKEYIEYKRHRYPNVFRYDTERDTFSEVEKIRGTDRKSEYIETLIGNLQEQARDFEGRLMNKETRVMNKLLIAISIFTILQVYLELLTQWKTTGASSLWLAVGSYIAFLALLCSVALTAAHFLKKNRPRRSRKSTSHQNGKATAKQPSRVKSLHGT